MSQGARPAWTGRGGRGGRGGTAARRLVGIGLVVTMAVGLLAACDPAKQVLAVGGVSQVAAWTVPNAVVGLYDANGQLVPTFVVGADGRPSSADLRHTDSNGHVVFRYVPVGSGYTVRRTDNPTTQPSAPVTVHSKYWRPDSALYTSQTVAPGYGYLRTRDGTLLSYMARLPGPVENGPYPTLVEYSGYAPSNPYELDGRSAFSLIANALGFATVGVNIRGSGCSGGSFQLWEDAQVADGYDAIETIAAQPWVKHNRVGMFGVSFPGNGALYAASAQPPSLAAIAVAGTYDDGFRDLLRPGGIVNSGFAREWIEERIRDATPATAPAWVKRRIADGDLACANAMTKRGQNIDFRPLIDLNPYFPTELGLGPSLAPFTFVNRITVPTFISASFQDEQVGGHMPTMIKNFTGTTKKRFVLANGAHADLYAIPEAMDLWYQFIALYVAKTVPDNTTMRALAPIITQQVMGEAAAVNLPYPPNRFAGKTYAQALAEFEADPKVKLLFESGGGADGTTAGHPHPSYSADVTTFPLPGTQVERWFFGAGGTLRPTVPTTAGTDTYVSDPAARPKEMAHTRGIWSADPGFQWTQPVAGKSLSYLSPALSADAVMAGTASVDLWLRSSATDTDLQVTLSEVRPDGKEARVQSGWLRASARKLDGERSTVLQPLPTMIEVDAAPMPAGAFTPVRVQIYPFAHAFRAGSRIRLVLSAPGGDHTPWAFGTLPGTQINDVARSIDRPSSIALPLVSGIDVPTAFPACPGLRQQPCRTYQAVA